MIERVTDVEDIKHPAVREAMKMLDMHELRLTYALEREDWCPGIDAATGEPEASLSHILDT